jgi:hypothetical protein
MSEKMLRTELSRALWNGYAEYPGARAASALFQHSARGPLRHLLARRDALCASRLKQLRKMAGASAFAVSLELPILIDPRVTHDLCADDPKQAPSCVNSL